MMTEKELREMGLHERRKLNDLSTGIIEITRVLGGWTYQYYGDSGQRVFVPEDRPSQWYPVTLSKDGDMWCCLLGHDLQEGLAGFGTTPEEACKDFDERWYKK